MCVCVLRSTTSERQRRNGMKTKKTEHLKEMLLLSGDFFKKKHFFKNLGKGTTESNLGETWMNLEFIIRCEVSQKEKNTYYTVTHIYGV